MNWRKPIVAALLLLTCYVSAFGQGAKDCRDFVVICSSTTVALNAFGIGTPDFENPNNPIPPCFQGTGPIIENNSLWLKIPIETDGTLEFIITPEGETDDFDFMVYGPNPDCNNLGMPLRCSTASPVNGEGSKLTGMSGSVSDASEGPGFGDGFVSELKVKAGEEYILFVDRFTQFNNSFDIELGGTATITSPPVANSPGIVEYCDPDGDDNLLINLSDLDSQISGGADNVSVGYFLTERDALLNINQLSGREYLLNVNLSKIWVRVINNLTLCSAINSFDIKLTSLQPNNDITGPVSVCPTVKGIPYSTLPTNADRYEWIIEGGTVASGQGTTDITVDWGPANVNAQIKLVAKSGTGCVGDTLYYPVRVNKRLEPETPKGPEQVCFTERLSTQYGVTPIPGSVYEWGVINGNIVGPNDQSTIEVNWDGFSGTGRVYLREFNPSIAECEGFSDTLNVTLFEEFLVNTTVTESRCAGDNAGSIAIMVEGGANGAVDIRWDDLGNSTDQRANLPPGNYFYTITDAQGCIATGNVIISEPPPLAFENVTPIRTSCYDSKDGGISLNITGGTGAYRYVLNDQTVTLDGNLLEITNLGMGSYDAVVLDENNCQIELPIVVSAPPLLKADLQSLIVTPSCPQSSTGSISLEAEGGTPDYRFTWEPNSNNSGNFVDNLAKGEYTVTITDMNNCQASLPITVDEVLPRVQMPNAFSPNGDDSNEFFLPVTNCPLGNYRFAVYNRWGSLVFNTTDISEGWDGRLDGESAPIGKYSYVVSYTVLVNDFLIDESIRGTVRIFR